MHISTGPAQCRLVHPLCREACTLPGWQQTEANCAWRLTLQQHAGQQDLSVNHQPTCHLEAPAAQRLPFAGNSTPQRMAPRKDTTVRVSHNTATCSDTMSTSAQCRSRHQQYRPPARACTQQHEHTVHVNHVWSTPSAPDWVGRWQGKEPHSQVFQWQLCTTAAQRWQMPLPSTICHVQLHPQLLDQPSPTMPSYLEHCSKMAHGHSCLLGSASC
jgi:hypothetical protein